MNKNIIIAVVVTIFVMLGLFFIASVFTNCISINSTNRTSIDNFKVGDKFESTMELKDPFREPVTYSGTIIAIQGDYVQFITERGDTSSTNLSYECENFKVKKLPK